MRQLTLEPEGWPCTFHECRPGLFVWQECVGIKSEYGIDDGYNEAGEQWWGEAETEEDRANIIVQPVKVVWLDNE